MAGISVIVPVYKVRPFLHRCVDSILNQSFSDFTLVLVDDGCPDHCGEICEEYAAKDNRIHVIHQKNGGLSAARNTGLDWVMENSDAQWIAFVDSDDWVHQDYLRLLYEAVQETGCLLSACGFQRSSGEPLPEDGQPPVQVMAPNGYYCSDEIHNGITAVAWNKLYHRSLFWELRYPVGKLHEDEFTTYLAVYAAGNVAVTIARLYGYYQNPEGIMLSQWNPRRLHILEAFEQQIAYARRSENQQLLNKAAVKYILSIHEQLSKASADYRKELRAKLRQGLKLGRATGAFRFSGDNLWAYEEAYPMKPLWWIVFRVKAVWDDRKGR